MSDLTVPYIICFQTKNQLATLNNIPELLKSVLIDLHAHNFMHGFRVNLFACTLHVWALFFGRIEALVCYTTAEEAKTVLADINMYQGCTAEVYRCTSKDEQTKGAL